MQTEFITNCLKITSSYSHASLSSGFHVPLATVAKPWK